MISPMTKCWQFELTLSGIASGMLSSSPAKVVAKMPLPHGYEMQMQLRVDQNNNLFGDYYNNLYQYELVLNEVVDYPIQISARIDQQFGQRQYATLSHQLARCDAIDIQPGIPLPIVGLILQMRLRSPTSADFKLVLIAHFPLTSVDDDFELIRSGKVAQICSHAEQLGSLLALGEFVPKDCKVVSTDGKIYDCHKALLALKSDVFQKAFEAENMAEAKLNRIQIDADSDIVDMLIPYLYAGKMPKITIESAMPLYRLAHLYHIEGLRGFLAEELVVKANQLVSVPTVLELVVFTVNFDLKVFQQVCMKFIKANCAEMLKLPQWKEFRSANADMVDQLLLL